MQGELEAGFEVPEERRDGVKEEHINKREILKGFDEVVEDGGEQGGGGEDKAESSGAEDDVDFADGVAEEGGGGVEREE